MRIAALGLLCLIFVPGGRPPSSFDFRYDILPLLHRQGCGSAYCHGSATGRGGFKLSLFGSDPREDWLSITHEFGGRRLDLREPEESLLLKKPTLRLRHGGGRRLQSGSEAYEALVRWIHAGAPYRGAEARELIDMGLERDGEALRVIADFGGEQRDVTALATFSSSNDRVAAVDDRGRLTLGQPGEAWLFARYVNRTARLNLVRPFGESATEASQHPLDRVWFARLGELGLRRGPRAPRHILARRLYLDLADRLPTPRELDEFEDVGATADALMRSPDFAQKFGRHLARWFEIPLDPPERRNPKSNLFEREHEALVRAVQDGSTLQDIARGILVTSRKLLDRFADPRDRSELCGRAVLGIRIGCARCHDSPTDRWERQDHLGFSALFASPRPRPGGGMRPGVLFHPETREPVSPKFLPVAIPNPAPNTDDLAERVAWFALRAGHGMFERNMANRVFAALLGRGLVEPLDDHRDSNPAVHEAVLAHLADVARSGDLREIVRHIVTSDLYQVTSAAGTEAERVFFARREARPLEIETYASAVAHALDRPVSATDLPRSPLARQLALLNSPLLHRAIDASVVLDAISAHEDPDQRLDELFRLILSRPPTRAERTAFGEDLNATGSVEDLAWALFASREFGSIR